LSSETGTGLSVFPNPASDQLNLSIPEQLNGLVLIRVMDLLGKEILNEQLQNPQGILPVARVKDLASGLYYVQVSNSLQTQTLKFVKQ
jgi:hypothetical protein